MILAIFCKIISYKINFPQSLILGYPIREHTKIMQKVQISLHVWKLSSQIFMPAISSTMLTLQTSHHESVSNTAWSFGSDGSPSKVNFTLRYKKKENVLVMNWKTISSSHMKILTHMSLLSGGKGKGLSFQISIALHRLCFQFLIGLSSYMHCYFVFDTPLCTSLCCYHWADLFWWERCNLIMAGKLATRGLFEHLWFSSSIWD